MMSVSKATPLDTKIAYLVSCYKLPDQTIALVNRLRHKGDTFLIHVDKKSSKTVYNKLLAAFKDEDDVVLLDRHKCYWGDFGHVCATLKGIKYLLRSSIEFSNFVVITGQDYPIQTTDETRRRISAAGNSMEYFSLPTKNWSSGGVDRLERYHYWLRGRHRSYGGRLAKKRAEKLIKTLHREGGKASFYGGSSYFQLDRSAVEYIDSFIGLNPWYTKFFSHTFISDELFFQTLLLNSPHAGTVNNSSLRYVDWSDPDESPKVLRENDLALIRASSAIFARKFDISVVPGILAKVDYEVDK